ncbi:MAG: phospholipid carrier-dependent glycosyltransferase, partial [Anaerolineae bacterium]
MSGSKVRWLLVVVGVMLWVLVVYPAYYVVHKPLSAASLRAIASVSADLLTWLAMMAVATALGSRLTRPLAYHSLLERLTLSAGLGLVLFSLLTFALGLAGLLYGWLFWVLLGAGGLALWKEFLEIGQALREASLPRPRGRWSGFLGLFVAASLLLALTAALLPPTEWDSLVYHLVGPERYLQAHRLTFDFDNYYLFFPSFVEMLFTAGMALKGDVVPRLLHFGYLLLTLGALGSFAARFWERRLGLLAAALFLSIPTAVQIASWSYVDLALTFYGLAAFYALLVWLYPKNAPRRSTGWLVLAGIFGGACLAIKYTGGATLLVLGAVLLWSLIRRRVN